PTEAEWSRAAGTTKYPWGDDWPPPRGAGNYCGQETRGKYGGMIEGYTDGFAETSPVGSFSANKHGLYDMGGNGWEWCIDKYDNQHDWRVLRGASWCDNDPVILAVSYRGRVTPGYRISSFGFRCVVAARSSF
ncbi:MAG: SUMF1/EgtB/PvdO family nonheme iron enzyme, partial [Verrucomicrobia bacterium]|nr:SUMF1/EgtB/PvdO family nonheme iron enzyme [Verrucomicrobiota bacterium]